jgi:hypothetical protein
MFSTPLSLIMMYWVLGSGNPSGITDNFDGAAERLPWQADNPLMRFMMRT